ncbi:HAD-IA family hydrolase [Lactococcus sp.]|uniref:HAD-IA family hydrolase n=1 Tax=Lactococcus sp. TaxID=44273 RepID=UPI0035B33DD3
MTNLIWDLDGTLLDSYAVFMESLDEVFSKHHLDFDEASVFTFIKQHSVNEFLKCQPISFAVLKPEFSLISKSKNSEIELMQGCNELLNWEKNNNIRNFIYTHKGNNTFDLLKQLGILDYFEEVVTSDFGFPRKPSPEAIDYLIEKHQLNVKETYYVGDRLLDIRVAENSGIQSINFLEDDKSIKMNQLTDIIDYFENQRRNK